MRRSRTALTLLALAAALAIADDGSGGDAPAAAPDDDTPAPRMQITRDVRYHTADGVDPVRLSLDVYAPTERLPETSPGRPVLLFVHGGGWAIGDKRGVQEKPRFFTDAGWVFVSTNYRFVPGGKHPVNVRDVARAIAWARRHAAEHGGDPDSIFLMGHSAGAHLAALVATDAAHLESVDESLASVRGVVLLDGAGYDVTWRMANLQGRILTKMYRDAFGEDDAELWRDASPMSHVRRDAGIPPFLVTYVASRPDAALISRRLVAKLRVAGFRAELLAARGKTHATINREFGTEDDEVTQTAYAFLTSVWESPRATAERDAAPEPTAREPDRASRGGRERAPEHPGAE